MYCRPTLRELLIPAFLLAAGLPVLLFLALDAWHTEHEAHARAQQAVRSAAVAVGTYLRSAALTLDRLSPLLVQSTEPDFTALAPGQAHFTRLAELAPDRVLRRWPGGSDGEADGRLLAVARPFFPAAQGTHTGVIRDPYTGAPTVLFAQPVGTRLIVGLLDPEPLLALEKSSGLVIRDQAGVPLLPHPGAAPGRGAAETGVTLAVTAPPLRWTVNLPAATPSPGWSLMPAVHGATAFLALATALALALVISRRLAGPLVALTQALKVESGGRIGALPPLPESTPQELEHLQRELARIARETATRSQEQEERLTTLERQLEEAQRNLRDANERLSARNFIDGLTRLGNRRALWKRVSDLERTPPDSYLPVQVLLFRLDNWQAIHDQYGPSVADQALAAIAGVLERDSRVGDFVVRYGCAEFLLLLRRCAADTARHRGEKLRAAILAQPPVIDGQPIPIELSVGLAQTESRLSRPSFDELLKAAHHALGAARPSCSASPNETG